MGGLEATGNGTPRVVKSDECNDYLLGRCTRGTGCAKNHHENLNPHQSKAEPGFMVPNELGQACMRCYSRGLECDKLGRDEDRDPCSECRWFAGPSRESCAIAWNVSYNDAAWNAITARYDHGYTLAELRDKEAVRVVLESAQHKKNKVPGPILDEQVKEHWVGEDKDTLKTKPPLLSANVRAHPRAYLVPARPSSQKKKSQRRSEMYGVSPDMRKRTAMPPTATAPVSSTSAAPPQVLTPLPQMPVPRPQYLPALPLAPADPYCGPVVSRTFDEVRRTWTHQYANGAAFTTAPIPQDAPLQLLPQPLRPPPMPVLPPAPISDATSLSTRVTSPSQAIRAPSAGPAASPFAPATPTKPTTSMAQASSLQDNRDSAASKKRRADDSQDGTASKKRRVEDSTL